MKCFYHADLDGQAAGFCVHAWVGLTDNKSTQFVEIDYKDRFPIETIEKDEQVWIVDFSIKPEQMRELLTITKDVTWIDHHKTAIDAYKDFEVPIKGLRLDGEAGCVLCWKYIHWFSGRGSKPVVAHDEFPELTRNEVAQISELQIPRMIELVGDRDIWAFEFGDQTRHFFSGSQLHDTKPDSEFWWKCLNDKAFWDELLMSGKIIESYKSQTDKSINKSLGFECEFEGYKCFAINRGKISSDRLGERIKQYDILLPYFHDGKKFTVSLYSEKIDVSIIAKKYGGGGHKGASGFQCKELPFNCL
jgi:uncharacterized protein